MHERPAPESLRGKRALITGGLGFIGSNLAIRLVDFGARVTLLDAMIDEHGANFFNIEPVKDRLTVNLCDVRDQSCLRHLVSGVDYIFHLAGQNDHVLSQVDPFPDIDINIKGSAVLLETCRRHNRDARLIYSGTRGEYGRAVKLPVGEDQAENPRGIYELSSLTAQKLFQIYHDNHSVRSVRLRLTNIYGPRAQMKHNRFGVANWFIRRSLEDETIKVFGDGSLLRDFLFVDDAVDAMLLCALSEEAYGHVFNVGNDHASSFRDLAETIVRVTGRGRWEYAPYSPERAIQETGDYYSDIRRIRQVTGWNPVTALEEGVRKTVDYYRKYKEQYW